MDRLDSLLMLPSRAYCNDCSLKRVTNSSAAIVFFLLPPMATRPRVSVKFVPATGPEKPASPSTLPAAAAVPESVAAGDKAFFEESNPSAVHAADVQPLPSDGIVAAGTKPFGAEYTVQLLRNRAMISADAVYRFLEDLGGMLGLTQTPWIGKAPGGQTIGLAFENAFSNLAAIANTTIKPILSDGLVTKISDRTKTELERGLDAIRTAAEARVGMGEEAKQVAGDLLGNVHARQELDILERQIKLVKAASELPDDRVGATVNRALGVTNLGGTPGVRVTTPVGPPPPGAVAKGGVPATALPVVAVDALPVETPAALAERARKKLEAQKIIATNPEIVLYRAMEEGRVTDAWYKAYNRLYYNDTGDSNLNKIAKFTEAVRSIERLLVAAGSARGNFAPANLLAQQLQAENLGILFIEPKTKTAILCAYEDIKNVARVRNVPLVEWMVQQEVRMTFMRLCALAYNDPIGRSFAARGSTNALRDRNADDRDKLLRLISTATYIGEKLVLAQTYDPGAAYEHAQREAALRRAYEETGEYITGRIDGAKLPKGPKGSLAEARKREKAEQDLKLAQSILFS